MAALLVRPPLLHAALLLGLTLLGGHESAVRREAKPEVVAVVKAPVVIQLDQLRLPSPSHDAVRPHWMADMNDYPRGMVIRPPETPDPMDVWVVGDWMSGLLRWLASGSA
jgi:hypothetical protein